MAAGTCAEMRAPAALVFDFDGVIVDSERLHWETMVEGMEGAGPAFDWAFYQEHLMGLDDRGAFGLLLARAGIEPSPEEMGRRIAAKAARFAAAAAAGRVPAYPHAPEFIRACAAAGPVGLCSGARRSDIVPVLESLRLAGCFSETVTAEDVARSKPDPASYRLCVERLAARFPAEGIAPGQCVAMEDTPDGIASARGAGLVVLGVATHHSAEVLFAAGASEVVASFAGLAPRDLGRLVFRG